MTPEQARYLLSRLETLNQNLDLVSSNLAETLKKLPDDSAGKKKAEAALDELRAKLGQDQFKRSFW